jgi:hypothetical protein
VGGVAGGSAQRKYEDLSRSWRRSMRKRFWVIGAIMAPFAAAFVAMLAVGKRPPDRLHIRDVHHPANDPTRVDRELAGRRVG